MAKKKTGADEIQKSSLLIEKGLHESFVKFVGSKVARGVLQPSGEKVTIRSESEAALLEKMEREGVRVARPKR